MRGEAPTIRPATMMDVETIVAFNQAMANETEDRSLDPAAIGAGVQAALEDPNRCMYFVAEADGAPVGQTMVTSEWSDWRNGYFWWIQSVYVDPRYRRRGIFRSLYEYIRDLAKTRPDVCGLRLYVHRDNRRALDTYRGVGMTLSDYLLCEEDWSTTA